MAETSNFLGLIEDIALDFELTHNAELTEVLKKIIAGDCGLERDRIVREFEVAWVFLGVGSCTS